MALPPQHLLTLTTQEVARILEDDTNSKLQEETLRAFSSLSLEERDHIQSKKLFSFGQLLHEIVLFENEALACQTLNTFLKSYPNWHTDFRFGLDPPLRVALKQGKLDVFRVLLEHGADPTSQVAGKNLLLVAVESCARLTPSAQRELVEAVLATKAVECYKSHALTWATREGFLGAVEALINHGAMSFARSDTLLSTVCAQDPHATQAPMREVVAILLNQSQTKQTLNDYWKRESPVSPLHHAAYRGNVEIMQILIDHGSLLDSHSLEDRIETPLMTASFGGQYEAICLLLKNGAKTDGIGDKNGWNALHFLASFQRPDDDIKEYANEHVPENIQRCADLLLHAGVSLSQKSDQGRTPIDLATFNGHECLASYLLSKALRDNVQNTLDQKDASKPYKM